MKPIKLKINTKTKQYPIIIGSNLCSNISRIIKENSVNFNQCLIVVDNNVPKNVGEFYLNAKKKDMGGYENG